MEPTAGKVVRAGNQKRQPAASGYLIPDYITNVRGKF